jgi:hypothetical protein
LKKVQIRHKKRVETVSGLVIAGSLKVFARLTPDRMKRTLSYPVVDFR